MPARALTVILAAGEGKRMHSVLPKVLHRVGGRPLVEHLVQASLKAGLGRVIVVVGHRRDMVIEALVDYPIEIVVQADQRGTGHAMQMVREHLGNYEGACLVVPGDVPFLRPETMHGLVQLHDEGDYAVTLLTAEFPDPSGYGRVVRDAANEVVRIVEDGDASPEERAIREINSAVYVFDYRLLSQALDKLRANNSQRELYLTDTIAVIKSSGHRVGARQAADPVEVMGVNDPIQLREAERIHRERQPALPPERPRPHVDLEEEEEEVMETVLGEEVTSRDAGFSGHGAGDEAEDEADEADDGAVEDGSADETLGLSDVDSDLDGDYEESEPAPSGVETEGNEP